MSKIKSKRLIERKDIENGNVNFEIGLNPRSNGIFFSTFNCLIIDKNLFKLKIITEINITNVRNNK